MASRDDDNDAAGGDVLADILTDSEDDENTGKLPEERKLGTHGSRVLCECGGSRPLRAWRCVQRSL
jgi:hypothetical protein